MRNLNSGRSWILKQPLPTFQSANEEFKQYKDLNPSHALALFNLPMRNLNKFRTFYHFNSARVQSPNEEFAEGSKVCKKGKR